ncbi:MAG: phage tail sheath subtilisin-like domain-containing protein [Chloroflexi bacterium OHK40]
MPTYQSPGVYIREISGMKSIQAAGTSVVAFVGFTKTRPVDNQPGEPRLVTSWTQYVAEFGDFVDGFYLPMSVYGYFQNGGGLCYVLSLMTADERNSRSGSRQSAPPRRLTLPGSAESVAGSLEVQPRVDGAVNVIVEHTPESEDQFKVTIRSTEGEESFDGLTLGKGRGLRNAVDVVNAQSKLVRLKELESPATLTERRPKPGSYQIDAAMVPVAQPIAISQKELEGDPNSAPRTGLAGLAAVEEITIVCMPDLMSSSPDDIAMYQKALVAHCEQMKDRVAILDAPRGLSPQQVKEWMKTKLNVSSSYAALYYPWVKVRNPLANGKGEKTILVPPSGLLAGVYARVDRERGVHKAPANEELLGVLDVERKITTSDQDTLNPDGINCIRNFPGRGIRVWGARTLAGGESEWRYVNVRRLFCMLEESIYEGTQWAVFEPNDMLLWARLRRDIGAFLKRMWLQGALFGNTPEEAYYVKCDAENNPPETRENGELYIEVGVAPVKPAEFIIISFKQISGVAQ